MIFMNTLIPNGSECGLRAGWSAAGVRDQYVDLGASGDSSRYREHPADDRGSGVQSDIADHQQIGSYFLGKIHQRMNGTALDRTILDIGRPRRPRAIMCIVQHRVDRRSSGDLVALITEGIGRA